MKKFVLAALCTLGLVGFVMADEFTAVITGIDKDGTVSFIKGKKKGEEGTKGTAMLAAKVKVAKGMFNKDDKKFTAGDDIENGVKNDMFVKATADAPVAARITIADDGADKGKITQILVVGKKKGN
jgi:hypothetical protein